MIWTIERNRALKDMMASGLSIEDMAARLGCAPINIRNKIAAYKRYGPETEEKICSLWHSGWSYERISQETRISKSAIRSILKRIGELDDPRNAHLRGIKHKINWTEELDQHLRDLHAQGYAVPRIARKMGFCGQTIRERMAALELTPHRYIPKNSWSSESENILEQKLKEGLSFSEIAKILGVTRSAVAGKAHRLGLRSKNKPNPTKKAETKKNRKILWIGRRLGDKPPQAHIQFLETICDDDTAGAVIFTELNSSSQCRWPVSGSGSTMLCCARQVDGKSPYCSKHRRRAFRAPPVRRKRCKYVIAPAMHGALA